MSTDNGTRDQGGEALCELARFKGGKLTVSLEAYQGHQFVALRTVDPEKGNRFLTLKVRELAEVITALEKARQRTSGGDGR